MTQRTYAMIAASGLALATAMPARAETVSLFCAATDYDLCAQGAETWAENTGNEVEVNRMPSNLDDAIPIYQQLFAAQSPDMDVLYIDVIWLGMFKNYLLDLAQYAPDEETAAHFGSALDAAKIDDKLVALPFYIDTGMMFYRTDLLEKYGYEAPTTWAELTAMAKDIQDQERAAGNDDMWGYAWQGRSYEGLTCDALEWIASNGGGTIIDEEGQVTLDNPKAAEALEMARGWVGDISPEGVLNYDEEASRALFESGNAVFLRNWPYVWGTSQAEGGTLVGKVGLSKLPVGQEGEMSSGCLGPAYLGVSKYSEHKEAAADLVRYMTGQENQKMRVIEGAYNPTITALYEDQEVLDAVPILGRAKDAFAESVPRPSAMTGRDYNRVSRTFYQGVHDILSSDGDVAEELGPLSDQIQRSFRSR